MTDLNSAFKSIFDDDLYLVKYGMTFAEAEADAEAGERELRYAKLDAFNEGFDNAYDLEPCDPLSDILECRTAYFQGYADGIESWLKIEYPVIHHLGRFASLVD